MPANVTFKLSEAMIGHQGPVQEIAFRQPLYRDYIALGPVERIVHRDEGGYIETDREKLAAYAERLLVDENLALLLGQLTLKDTLALERLIIGFFEEAATSTPQPTN